MLLKAVFWDMDGTLIDSEPYWHESEMMLAREHGGQWSSQLAWEGSGKPVPSIAEQMIALGTQLSVEEIVQGMIGYVYRREKEHMPWAEGVEAVLQGLVQAGIPSVLVTTSPRSMAQNLVEQAPAGAFIGYVCGDDAVAKKPDPAPYRKAAEIAGVAPKDMAYCIAVEDSLTGLASAAASGATTIAQTALIRTDTSQGPQFATIHGYTALTPWRLDSFVEDRLISLGGSTTEAI